MNEAALVINADDAGFDAAVDEAILESARKGILTSASVSVIGETAADFVAAARDLDIGIGLHFNITEGRPLTGAKSLVTGEGAFFHPKRLVWQLLAEDRFDHEELKREARAQLVALRDLGAEVDHLDSHNHVHCYPGVFEALLEAASGEGLHVRVPDEPECPPEVCPPMPEPKLHPAEMHRRIRSSGARSLDRFVGFAFSMAVAAESFGHLSEPHPGGTEWMVHPGIRSGSTFTESELRARESKVLRQDDLIATLSSWGYRRCRFGDLR